MVFPLDAAADGDTGLTKEKYPKIMAYLTRLKERPAFQRAVQKIKDETGEYVASVRVKA